MKRLRTLTLATLVLALTSTGLPARDALARLSRRAIAAAHRRGNHRHCRHSRAWWRNYRRQRRERQQRAAERRRRRQLASRAERLAKDSGAEPSFVAQNAASPIPSIPRASRPEPTFRKAKATAPEVQGPRNPFDFALPRAWRLSGANGRGLLKFAVTGSDGRATATATLAPFQLSGPSAAQDVITPRTKLFGGVALPVLRRAIIDRMVLQGGWVMNDMEREIQGRRVYVVTAQTGQGGVARESWTFYFTEVEGRLYTLATNAPVEFSAPVAADSEQLLATLRGGTAGGALAGKPRR